MSGELIEVVAEANRTSWPPRLPLPPVVEAADGVRADFSGAVPSLTLRHGEHWVAVHSRRDPERDAARSLDGIDLTQTSTLFVVGLGLGYIIDILERRDWPGKVVAFEPAPATIDACLRRRDWRAWLASGRLAILSGPGYEGLDALIPTLDPCPEQPVIIVNPVVARVYGTVMPDVLQTAARAWFGARANQEAKRRNGGRYLLNTLRNTAVLARAVDVQRLAGQFTGTPAILVAAGPSLDRNLRDIGTYRHRAVVIAVDTAARPLLNAGVQPDLVVAVDPGEANARHLVDLPACPRTWLVSEGSVDPEALRTFGDRVFAFRLGDHQPWPWLRQQGIDCGRLRAWGSVLTTALDLALTMGCDPVVFTGADLAFTEGQPYARGTVYEEDWRREEAWGRSLEDSWAFRVNEWPETVDAGVAGGTVRTAPHLIAFRDWLVTESGRSGRRIVNASGGGILAGPGITQSSLDEVFQRRPLVDAEIQSRLSGLQTSGTTASPPPLASGVADETLTAWAEFGRMSRDALISALQTASTPAIGDGVDHNERPAGANGAALQVCASPNGGVVSVPAPAVRLWVVPTWRMMGEPGRMRTVWFRTDAARWYLTDPRASIRILENGRALMRFATIDELAAATTGGWVLVRDELTIATADQSDPRCNGRRYAVECPGFVAWAESQSLADTLGHVL